MSDFWFVTLGFGIGIGFTLTAMIAYAYLAAASEKTGQQTRNNEESPRG